MARALGVEHCRIGDVLHDVIVVASVAGFEICDRVELARCVEGVTLRARELDHADTEVALCLLGEQEVDDEDEAARDDGPALFRLADDALTRSSGIKPPAPGLSYVSNHAADRYIERFEPGITRAAARVVVREIARASYTSGVARDNLYLRSDESPKIELVVTRLDSSVLTVLDTTKKKYRTRSEAP